LCIIVSNEADVAAFKDYVDNEESEAPKVLSPAAPAPAAVAASTPQPINDSIVQAGPAYSGSQRVFISPLAKQLAAAQGHDINQLIGSGPNGRIRAADVLNARLPSATAAASSVGSSSTAFTDQPLTAMRSTIARRLSESKSTIPHYYLTVDIEVNELMKLRQQMNTLLATESKSKLSLNDFVVKAAALACKQVPEVNSSWQDTHIRRYDSVDISLAVSTDAGLITPIVFNAERLGVREISDQVKQLAGKAREGRLQPAEYQGGTFTISNLGMFGVGKFAAVINPPQAAILAVGSIESRLLPNATATNDGDRYRTAQMLSVTLSCDHRVVDGAVGARWLQQFTRYLSNPFSMVL
jgi:pyruvate dehydrogenase E2 component (dihydrolipoamide acetyltransferase)